MDRNTALSEASSSDVTRRAAAGQALAQFADDPVVQPVLRTLLLDVEDTYVTAAAAEALAARGDEHGLRLVALAYASTAADQDDTAEEMLFAVLYGEQVDQTAVQAVLRRLVADGDAATQNAATQLLDDVGPDEG